MKNVPVEHVKNAPTPAPALEWEAVSWIRHPGLRKLYLLMPILFLASTTRGYDASLLNGLQTVPAWRDYFGHPQGSELGLISATSQFGSLAAILVAPYIADRYGRKFGAGIGNLFIIVGAIIQVVPGTTKGMFMGGRVLLGFGSNISEAAAPLLVVELAHPQHRGTVSALFNVVFYIGAILAAWTVYGCLNLDGNIAWRVPTALQAAMPCIQIVLVWFVPESPRWLISKDRCEEARAILDKYHANGDQINAFVEHEFREICETLRLEAAQSKSSWLVFVQTRGNRKRLLLVLLVAFFSQCSGNGLISYYLHSILELVGIMKASEQALINGAITIWGFIIGIVASLVVDRFGRRNLFLFASSGMLVVFSIWTACSAVYTEKNDANAGKAVIGMMFLFNGVIGWAFPGLIMTYTTEILPYHIRAKGVALCWAFISIASLVNQYVNPIGLQTIAWKYYFVYIAILAIEVLTFYFVFPETKGIPLEEVAMVFDKDTLNPIYTAHGSRHDTQTNRRKE
ncbi:general substrate transporter [Aspergillus pseudoustus]|uniref:General substrate transporter n=1 Tax=Aspergillus pseudoustus TaxID=1810923 RepID=A0ABR4JCG8_9EURO